VIMPSGLLLDLRGNAFATPLNLNMSGKVRVPVYCHVLSPDGAGEATGEALPDEEGQIPRAVWRLVLSIDQVCADALENIKLAAFEKDPDGGWHLSGDTIPPLLQVGTSPFLRAELEDLGGILELFQHKVSQEMAASYLSGDSMFSAKECLKSTLRVQRFLANVLAQVHPHPYHVYEVLKELLTEVSFYRDATPEYVADPYDHEDLSACFKKILEPLRQHIRLFQRKSPYLPFELGEGLFSLTLPTELREAREAYLLVQKSQVNQKVSLENLKITSRNRLTLVHKLALQGIPLRKIDRPPFQHKFGPEVDFYFIQEGEEWDQALRELSLVFYDTPAFKETRFYLYWRTG